MRRLIERADEQIREDIGDYYIVQKHQLENIILCFEQGAARIKSLAEKITEQQKEIEQLVRLNLPVN